MRPRPSTILFLLAVAAGLFFTGYSTSDFVQHLDRQVHGIHCSFIPGLTATDASGTSGCHTTLMSPYSSVFRQMVWGGIPISLPGMAVFAFLLFRGLDLWLNRREREQGTNLFLLAATGVPVLTSLVMGYIALVELDAACKLCIGTYVSSFTAFGAALWGYLGSKNNTTADPFYEGAADVPSDVSDESNRGHVLAFAQGVGFVIVPVLLYLVLVPDYSSYVGTCGTLPKPEDNAEIMLDIDGAGGGLRTIEVLDPLCPSCRGMEQRLDASGLAEKLDRKAVLFPLDNTCNWTVGTALHPGACTVSEAMLCAGDKAREVLDWSFENQQTIREESAKDPEAAKKLVIARFPELKACIGSAGVKSRLNRSLRWAVANQIPVLTPQLYVGDTKLCDEDTDLGMDYALSRLIEKKANP